ncbi:GNAT family N-acetyltransferase [Halobacteriales archaeon QH_10_67_13]|nr:MAG: GNAT family N-acetyltransferase [Halobacteriales archaeon QH_10_67_13]
MEIRPVEAAEGPIRRYIEELWLPYMRELEEVVKGEGLSPEFDVEAEIEWQIDRFDAADSRLWVALEDADESTAPLGAVEATFAGFVGAELDPAPSSFDQPDSVVVGDFYVAESFRGGELADRLIARAVGFAREHGCEQLALDVDIDNERALAYYEKLGFEVRRHRMAVPIEELRLDA